MSPRTWFVVPAAGASRRLGGGVPKQYLEVCGRTVLEHALRALFSCPEVAGGVVVIGEGDPAWPGLPAALRARVRTAPGGRERCHSVLSGVAALEAADEDWVLVHDAARPCLDPSDLARLVEVCRTDPVGGLLALPVADTLKRGGDDGRVAATVPRESLWRAQTPQMFRRGPLQRALEAAIAAGETPSDEAAAMERAGLRPLLVAGSPFNIKITHAADLDFAAVVLASRREGRV
ncbi:MAG: 2-C-methyl-D-erythritol 4-phosphate cytidylyltransferase [Proteobacteria bacterium]|nr:2-C-methyl-D-erythritol 4-phosphate cytidylyltransferase [Pseudomonadota bacterium]